MTDWHGKPPDAHRYACTTCGQEMSTPNLTPGLSQMWRAAHDGHDTSEAHETTEPCTGPGEEWCPNCGTCACPVTVRPDGTTERRDTEDCPIHGLASFHPRGQSNQ